MEKTLGLDHVDYATLLTIRALYLRDHKRVRFFVRQSFILNFRAFFILAEADR